MIDSALADSGAEADFQVIHLDFNGVTLAAVRFGAPEEPDASIARVDARWRWSGLSPRLQAVRIQEPQLRLRMDRAGRISAGALDRIGGSGSRRRASIPNIALEIVDGRAEIEAPFGLMTAEFRADGEIGRDFTAIANIAQTSLSREGYALENGAGDLVISARGPNLVFRLNLDADAVTWSDARVADAHLRMMGAAPLDLSRADAEAALSIATLRAPNVSADALQIALGGEGLAREDALAPSAWTLDARLNAATLSVADYATARPRFVARAEGGEASGEGGWTLAADRFNGLAMISERPAGRGTFSFELSGDETARGQAQFDLLQARLDSEAQSDLARAFPSLSQSPVGPTFAQAERALLAAGNRFDLTVPLSFDANEAGARLMITAPVDVRAASGALVRLAPLRADTPAVVLQWPGPTLSGAVALELQGGGAPHASLLLDTLTWSPDAPMEADGTLTLSNWRAGSAEIATEELGVSFSAQPERRGSLDLRGTTRVTGPLGDGEVRNLVADLDLTYQWGNGWRVTPTRGCIPVRLGGLDAAGLSFSNGAFSLCSLNGQLIAADVNQRLSGGFVIERLALDGRMSGPNAEPARLNTSSITGRFSGTQDNMTLAMQAQAPTLAIDLGPERTLAIRGSALTADAHIADSWRVEGAFRDGVLTDPALPGSISAIEGGWTASPVDDKPVIRVVAGEALLVANRPATDDERPLFNPLRIIEMDATLSNGAINATGAIVLEADAHRLALFTATHDISEGSGAAQVNAENVVFDANLQPYDITEQARGLVDNVRGPIDARASIAWTREAITATGRVDLNGISLATSTIPVVQDVRGSIAFDDLFLLTTPPGQAVTVGLLNPGIAVRNGRVRFQLLTEQRVAIEEARFDFASGELAMRPTTIALGADETNFVLTLDGVDAANLVANLNLPDIAVTGQLEGTFPLLLTRRSAFIQNGVLRATEGGGSLAYTGNAGAGAEGMSRIAFDALKEFRYDTLQLTLDGDLSGEVVSAIEFSGRNAGDPIDLGPIMQIPGTGSVTVRGVPFDFNVRVSAPFRRLAQTAASITDPGSLINQANDRDEEAEEAPEEQPQMVDPEGE